MATKGFIKILGTTSQGIVVEPSDHATMQILLEAYNLGEQIEIRKAWPRRRGGRAYPKLKLAGNSSAP